jgi:hypothetical protein
VRDREGEWKREKLNEEGNENSLPEPQGNK